MDADIVEALETGSLNLRDLRTFVAVVELGGFARAAAVLSMAQSTASGHVQELERCLGARLLVRGSRPGVELTREGKRVYPCAREILRSCAELCRDAARARAQELAIAASSAPTYGLLPECLAQFARAMPGCRVTVRGGDTGQVTQMLLAGDIQVGIVGACDDRRHLSYEKVAQDHLVLVAPNTARFRRMRERGDVGRDLLRGPLICRDGGSGTQRIIDNYLGELEAREGACVPAATYCVSSAELQLDLVARGAGVSIASMFVAHRRIAAGELLAFELDDSPLRRPIYVAHARRGSLSEPAQAFLAVVREAAARGALVEACKVAEKTC